MNWVCDASSSHYFQLRNASQLEVTFFFVPAEHIYRHLHVESICSCVLFSLSVSHVLCKLHSFILSLHEKCVLEGFSQMNLLAAVESLHEDMSC